MTGMVGGTHGTGSGATGLLVFTLTVCWAQC